ncbi:hypothetical protein FJ651_15600 [Paucihalobacter ruber]|uniref:Uncharacterized protein n=1 Tax=Paucihalobacter ruber TaxID=2567861 RepID=A0A506PDN7_9FLAO|nr:hypothetical protein [Paucihalobacter ruber]TPV31122.1 hypothetical protein FJ651_15600 [Paucihalobacter ruber]
MGDNSTLIHSHPLNSEIKENGNIASSSAEVPGPDDPSAFTNFGNNIIVGRLGFQQGSFDSRGNVILNKKPTLGAAFFGKNITTKSLPKLSIPLKSIEKITRIKYRKIK